MAQLGVIFDIDGTLCDTNDVDDECYRAAAASALNVPASQIDWTGAPHQTDSGIVRWLWERWRARPPTPEEVHRLRLEFLRGLESAQAADARRFRAVREAPQFLDNVRRAGAIVGVATGGWRVSAELKLSTVGVPTDLLYATADDAEARVDIFGLAWTRATAHSARPGVTVLVGDSVWDVATARRLGWRFLGVGRGANARHLREAGAALIVPDYADLDACDTLERCQVPGEKTHGESFQEVHHARTLRPRGRAAP